MNPSPLVEWIRTWKEDANYWLQTVLRALWIVLLALGGMMLTDVAWLLAAGKWTLSPEGLSLSLIIWWIAVALWYIPKGAFQKLHPTPAFAARVIMVAIPIGVGWYFARHGVHEVLIMGVCISSFAVSYNVMQAKKSWR